MADDEDLKRPWREQYQTVGRTMVPLWFAVTGIALGVGGVIRDEPLAGACGAVAGVTVGWLQQQRASVYRRHNVALRKRLKKVRAEAKEKTEALEQRVSALQTEVLEQKMMRMLMNPNAEAASELTGEIPAVKAPIVHSTHAPAPDWTPAQPTPTTPAAPASAPGRKTAAPAPGPETAAPATGPETAAPAPAAPAATAKAATAKAATAKAATAEAPEPAVETPAAGPVDAKPAAPAEHNDAKPEPPIAEAPAEAPALGIPTTTAEAPVAEVEPAAEAEEPAAPAAEAREGVEVAEAEDVGAEDVEAEDVEAEDVEAEDVEAEGGEDTDAAAEVEPVEPVEEAPRKRGAQIIDLPGRLKARAKRQDAQAG